MMPIGYLLGLVLPKQVLSPWFALLSPAVAAGLVWVWYWRPNGPMSSYFQPVRIRRSTSSATTFAFTNDEYGRRFAEANGVGPLRTARYGELA